MSEYIKLEEAPVWVVQYPTCSACNVELEYEDGWTCPVCGTYWPGDASDGDTGSLYEEWSGESINSDPVDEEEASRAGMRHQRERTQRLYAHFGWCEHGLSAAHGSCPGGRTPDHTVHTQEKQ